MDYTGGGGLELTPRDMAKFGYLYLNKGLWEGRSIVPAAWVEASTTSHIDTGDMGYQAEAIRRIEDSG